MFSRSLHIFQLTTRMQHSIARACEAHSGLSDTQKHAKSSTLWCPCWKACRKWQLFLCESQTMASSLPQSAAHSSSGHRQACQEWRRVQNTEPFSYPVRMVMMIPLLLRLRFVAEKPSKERVDLLLHASASGRMIRGTHSWQVCQTKKHGELGRSWVPHRCVQGISHKEKHALTLYCDTYRFVKHRAGAISMAQTESASMVRSEQRDTEDIVGSWMYLIRERFNSDLTNDNSCAPP